MTAADPEFIGFPKCILEFYWMGRDYIAFIKGTFPPHFEQTHPGFRVESLTLLEMPSFQWDLISVEGVNTLRAKAIRATMKLSLAARDVRDEAVVFSGILVYEADNLHEPERIMFRLQ